MKNEIVLQTERTILRKMDLSDFDELCKLLKDEEVMYAYEGAFSDEEVKEWLNNQLKRYKEDGFGLNAVIKKETGEFIGQCGLTYRQIPEGRVVEIGYLLKKEFWHKGYATECAKALKRYAFDVLKVKEVYSIIRDNNIASQKVAKANGMCVCGQFTKHYRGVDMLQLIYSVRAYKQIDVNNFERANQYEWFRKFSNPCYGFNVKMDVTKIVEVSKATKTRFFINTLYLITKGLNSVDELRMRDVNGEIRLYNTINPTFTVMTINGSYENAGFKMIEEYGAFYKKCEQVLDDVKNLRFKRDSYNDNELYDDYYMTCIPWISFESMTHPLINGDYSSLSCPRVCWDKYREENDRFYLTLNVTVSHCFVDGKPLSEAFNNIQALFSRAKEELQ